jgi:hypothetical protein
LSKEESESTDLASQYPEVVERIRDLMAKEHTPSKEFPIKVID